MYIAMHDFSVIVWNIFVRRNAQQIHAKKLLIHTPKFRNNRNLENSRVFADLHIKNPG